MKYVVLVSHGTFAYGLHNALKMLAGEAREDILSFGLENGTGADALAERMKERLGQLQEEDEVVLLGDLVGGSPLTTAANAAAGNPVLKSAYKSASGKKTFVWTLDEFKEKCEKVLASKDRYFLITKNPVDMKKILVDQGFKPGIDQVIIGPCNDRPGSVKLGNNQSITQEEAQALEDIMQAGYNVEFALLKEEAIGNWKKFRGQFGFN